MYIRHSFRTSILGLVAVGLRVTLAAPAGGYPIDCAILLCLAGGFPASAECSAAHAEMLRRITPVADRSACSVLALPMGGTVGLSRNFGEPFPEIRMYRDGIEVWQLSKRTSNSSGGRESEAYTVRSFYDAAGTFQSGPVDPLTVPPWIDEQVRIHTGTTLLSDFGSFDAILMRHHNHQGEPSYEWIRY